MPRPSKPTRTAALRTTALPRVRRTQAERSETMRKRLLDAAVSVIMNRGYLGFTTLEAAKVAGVTRGAPHHHFRNADAFLLAALEHLFSQTQLNSQRKIAHLKTSGEVLRELTADARKVYFSPAFFAGLDVLLSARKKSRTRLAVKDLGNRYRGGNEEMWRDHLVSYGFDRTSAETAVWILLSLVRGLAIRTVLKHDVARIDEAIEVGLRLVRRFLDESRPGSRSQSEGQAR